MPILIQLKTNAASGARILRLEQWYNTVVDGMPLPTLVTQLMR